jgi:phytoene dehydrogenase-like protein
MSKKIIIIGSGFGGLGAAVRLAARGYQVELFERRDKLGGRAYVYEQNGFKFDGGPTIVTAPFMFDDIWNMAGANREAYVQFVECNPITASSIRISGASTITATKNSSSKKSASAAPKTLRVIKRSSPVPNRFSRRALSS